MRIIYRSVLSVYMGYRKWCVGNIIYRCVYSIENASYTRARALSLSLLLSLSLSLSRSLARSLARSLSLARACALTNTHTHTHTHTQTHTHCLKFTYSSDHSWHVLELFRETMCVCLCVVMCVCLCVRMYECPRMRSPMYVCVCMCVRAR
jgi:hypothetical protein